MMLRDALQHRIFVIELGSEHLLTAHGLFCDFNGNTVNYTKAEGLTPPFLVTFYVLPSLLAALRTLHATLRPRKL